MFNSFFFFDIIFWIYLAAACCYIFYMGIKKEGLGHLAFALTVIGWLLNSVVLVVRWYETGRAPYANLYETMVLLSWMIVAGYIAIELKYKKLRVLGAIIVSIAFLAIGAAAMLPYRYQAIEPLIPALQSNWLVLHVVTTFIGYAGFAIAFGLGIMYLFKERAERSGRSSFFDRFPSSEILDDLNYKFIAIGFPFVTLGIILGAIWANYAWGGYWSWDPKETWSLIVWFIYAGYFHGRLVRGWKGRKTAYFSIIGFTAVIFLYWGVSFVLPGLHAYA
ncbi:MAG: c-type cytochrome biogenesis protein CcsB [Nitrospirae bacterium RIFCSPLOWO2_02_42_7]|nr:MAG: c-type cytochrome biogenesis protein CcsB [Nitrospirae bacterium RIFCSPLOWO2_02_42_7]